ncbi:MAG: hypothetical protein ACOC8Y_04215 [Candidatus Natronoplasma sp.]
MGEETSKNIGSTGFAIGLILGGGLWTTIWMVGGGFLESDITFVFSQGIAVGILIGTISSLALIKGWFGEKEWRVVPFAMGWGTLVGTAVGFLSSWSMDLPYLDTFSLGAGAGLICGILIGTLLLAYVRKKEE